jgi:endonuclease/exonuclease/phosphatase family metal-dependent hydrolase
MLPDHEAIRHADIQGESAARILAQAGFVDVGAVMSPHPQDRRPTAGIPRAPVRCDRIYVSQRLRDCPLEYRTLDDDEGLSDHRLVVARLDLDRIV